MTNQKNPSQNFLAPWDHLGDLKLAADAGLDPAGSP